MYFYNRFLGYFSHAVEIMNCPYGLKFGNPLMNFGGLKLNFLRNYLATFILFQCQIYYFDVKVPQNPFPSFVKVIHMTDMTLHILQILLAYEFTDIC